MPEKSFLHFRCFTIYIQYVHIYVVRKVFCVKSCEEKCFCVPLNSKFSAQAKVKKSKQIGTYSPIVFYSTIPPVQTNRLSIFVGAV